MKAALAAVLGVLFLSVTLLDADQGRHRSKRPAGSGRDGTSSAVASLIQQAKSFMIEGNRKKAIERLDQARSLVKAGPEVREVEGKRLLFAEQFLTSEAFQNFQEAKSMAEAQRWDECLRSLDAIGDKDRDNLLVLRLRARADMELKQVDNAAKAYGALLTILPGDTSAKFGLVEIALAQKNTANGLSLLDTIEPSSSPEIERHALLKAKLLELADRAHEATELLREDQEKHLDHVDVLYELGMLYTRIPGHDWQARKLLSLFVTRCKRMKDTEVKAHGFDVKLPQAQIALSQIDSKLGV